MVTRPASFCDVMIARGDSPALATEKKEITIPAAATEDGKTIRRTFDVSPEGAKILDQMMAKMTRGMLAASKEIRDMQEKLAINSDGLGTMTAKPARKKKPTTPATEAQPSAPEHNDDGQQHN